MNENESSNKTRQILIVSIAILGAFQVAILVVLGSLLGWGASPGTAEPTAVPQLELPWAGTVVSEGGDGTPTLEAGEPVVGPLVPANTYGRAAAAFDEEEAMAHLAVLASDDMEGRQPGTPGGQAAGDYIADRFAEYGLEPAGVDGTFFQPFSVPYGRIVEVPVLEVRSSTGTTLGRSYTYRNDYRALTGGYLGAGEGEGPVIWLNECRRDDYAGLDVVGQIVLCRYTGRPEVYRQAIEHRVGGVLLLDREGTISPYRRPGYRDTAWVPETIPAYVVSETVAGDLLAGSDYSLDDLSLRFTPTPLSTTVRMAVVVEEREGVEARNVLGLLPGADPVYAGEVVVLGAHYDHLGREPDGAIMNGANDNGSGVATVLEVARLWQAQGYRPARSVLFAAWDAEEIGLLGSGYYVAHPTLPLTRTVANLNLDMIGAGEALEIDGQGPVATQLQAGAESFGITTTLTSNGRSDHASFYQADVPAAMLIYWPDRVYHSVDDELDVVVPQKLKSVGVLSAHTLAALADGHPQLERAVQRFRLSVVTGDREAFLAGVDPGDPGVRATQADWFDNLWSRELTDLELTPNQLRIGDGEAWVNLTLSYRWEDTSRQSSPVSYDVCFVERNGAWVYGGYGLDEVSGPVVTVARFAEVPVATRQLLTRTERAYLALVADLGATPITGTRFIYHPSSVAMRATARPAADRDARWLISSPEVVDLAANQPITPALVNLVLTQWGLPPDEGAWLREGMVRHYEARETGQRRGSLASEAPASLADLAASDRLPEDEEGVLHVQAWSAVEYLLDRHGSAGLRALCTAWDGADQETAFRGGLGISLAEFERSWRAERVDPLAAAIEGVEETLDARVRAVSRQDEAAYLATVNPGDDILQAEERDWFAGLAESPVEGYEVSGEIVDWAPDEGQAVVDLAVSWTVSGGQRERVEYDARFVRQNRRWFYAGVAWEESAGPRFVLKVQDHNSAWAAAILASIEEAYDRVAADLPGEVPIGLEIKVYGSTEVFRASVAPGLSEDVESWASPGGAIKVGLGDDDEQDERLLIQDAVARQLASQTLYAQGVKVDWLREGVSALVAGRATPLGTHRIAGRYWPLVQDAIRRHNAFSLTSMPDWEDVEDDRRELFAAQSWSVATFVADRAGMTGLREWVARSGGADGAATDVRAVVGLAGDDFEAQWQAYALAGGVDPDLVSLARGFDVERALNHVGVLAGPEMGGREAGSPGAALAADYVEAQFATLGLQPMGDWSVPMTGTISGEMAPGSRGYQQMFPISYTQSISLPTLTLLGPDGDVLHEFVYREEFLELAGDGAAQGNLVWVRNVNLEGLRLGGAIVMQQDLSVERAQDLQAHGASGVVAVAGMETDDLQADQAGDGYGADVSIPVFEISDGAFEILLERLGRERLELTGSPPALPLDAQMSQWLSRPPVTTTETTNVLGLLPGADPALADEVILVGAHYDHAGRSPDGLYFPGANQNGSGVAVMLEMARLWRSAGYRPARSVLFVAWGAEEVGRAGVAHYLADPAVPLTQTVAVYGLDSVAGGKGYRLMFHGTREHDLALIHRLESGYLALDRRAWREGNTGEGWHEPFNQAGIPTVKLIWDRAEEQAYSLEDTVENLDPDRLATAGEVLTLAVSWVARE